MTSPTLRGQGVAVLLAFWAELYEPKLTMPTNGEVDVLPGVECSGDGDVTVRAVAYESPEDAHRALNLAASVCLDAGLLIRPIGDEPPHSGFLVRRRPGGAA